MSCEGQPHGHLEEHEEVAFAKTITIQTDRGNEPQAGWTLFSPHTFAASRIRESLIIRSAAFASAVMICAERQPLPRKKMIPQIEPRWIELSGTGEGDRLRQFLR